MNALVSTAKKQNMNENNLESSNIDESLFSISQLFGRLRSIGSERLSANGTGYFKDTSQDNWNR